jgi:4-amino-4-deoxy-L-arabinose transferase-like glycosyltransferase
VAQTSREKCGSHFVLSSASRREQYLVVGLCLVGAIRVFIFCAAFPFFNNVDEKSHFDLVFKYSRGHLPVEPLEKFDPDAAEIIASCNTGGYFVKPGFFTPEERDKNASLWKIFPNLETWAWPVYYILAGFWCWLGKIFHPTDLHLLYWIRFLNVLLMAALVWVSYVFSRKFLQTNSQMRIALPLMVAFFPQDIFFAITADVLSPLLFAAAMVMLLAIYTEEKNWQYHFLAGLAVAATFLTKASNIAIVLLAAVLFLNEMQRAVRQKRLKSKIVSLSVFASASIMPVALWLGRNYVLFGDFSGAAASIEARTWTAKPFKEMLNHQILMPRGASYFLAELTRTFWRGEFIWNNERIASGFMDWFYIISSALFISTSIIGFAFGKRKADSSYRAALSSGLLVIVVSVVFLAVMSMRYDFGQCFYPSREKPYFTSGRLIAGAILPFLLLYIDGLYRFLSKLRLERYLFIAVAIIAGIVTTSEIILSWPVFVSPYNWFYI